jgi:myosin heavy subunit
MTEPPVSTALATDSISEPKSTSVDMEMDLDMQNVVELEIADHASTAIASQSPSPSLEETEDNLTVIETNPSSKVDQTVGSSLPPSPKSSAIPESCSCALVFASVTSKNCSLCDQPIPALEEARNQSIESMETLDVTKRELQECQQRMDLQEQHMSRLNNRVQELEQHLETKSGELVRLKKDMQALNTKYVSEINRVSDIQHEKDLLEQELEELSRRLFEEANGMVAFEKREKWNLEVAYRQLEGQLIETEERLSAEQSQLQELRSRMEEMMLNRQKDEEGFLKVSAIYGDENGYARPSIEEKIKRISANDPYFRAQLDMARLHGITKESSTASSSSTSLPPSPSSQPSHPHNKEIIDDYNLLEFRDFVQVSAITPVKKLHSIPFLKHCLNEDVEPCLRFGANPRLSSRKIADAIMVSPCFIEESSEGYEVPSAPARNSGSKQSWFTSSNTNSAPACHACGQPAKIVHFRFKLVEQDDWSYIDEGCRERLVAVCEFYVFIRNTQLGHYGSRTMDDLYAESVRLRLQMFYSR